MHSLESWQRLLWSEAKASSRLLWSLFDWPHELWRPQVLGRPRSEDFARVWILETTRKPLFCFNAFLFSYFVSIMFYCTTVLSWTTARNISLSIIYFFNFFIPSNLVFRGFKNNDNNDIYKQRIIRRAAGTSFSADEEMRYQASCKGGRGQYRQAQFSW